MRITICDDTPVTIYVNDKKHWAYGYRACVEEDEEFRGIWEDSKISQEEAIGKLLCRLTGERKYNIFTGKREGRGINERR